MDFYNPFGGMGAAPEQIRYAIVKKTDAKGRPVFQLMEQINNDVEGATKKGYDIIFTTEDIVAYPDSQNEATLQSVIESLTSRIEELEKKP